jgi:hypothetical protein
MGTVRLRSMPASAMPQKTAAQTRARRARSLGAASRTKGTAAAAIPPLNFTELDCRRSGDQRRDQARLGRVALRPAPAPTAADRRTTASAIGPASRTAANAASAARGSGSRRRKPSKRPSQRTASRARDVLRPRQRSSGDHQRTVRKPMVQVTPIVPSAGRRWRRGSATRHAVEAPHEVVGLRFEGRRAETARRAR